MKKNADYLTLTDAVNGLQKKGYNNDNILDFIAKTNDPEKFRIMEFYRFEGESNPSDNSIIYAIASDTGEKGIVIDSFGSKTDPLKTKLLSKIKFEHKN